MNTQYPLVAIADNLSDATVESLYRQRRRLEEQAKGPYRTLGQYFTQCRAAAQLDALKARTETMYGTTLYHVTGSYWNRKNA